jgi:hypothetical protein
MLLRGGFRAQRRLSKIDQAKMFHRYTLIAAKPRASSPQSEARGVCRAEASPTVPPGHFFALILAHLEPHRSAVTVE